MAMVGPRALPCLTALLLAGCAFSLLSPARTVRATVTSAGPRGGAAPAGVTGSGSSSASLASAAVLLCGAASLARRRDQVVCRAGKQYWEGEWICADCGYIYNERAFGMKFEDLGQGFKCPQCAAPRRRFARKLGDKIGTTLDGGDTPILIFTAVCLLIVLAIAYYSLQ
ncbi:unnamed protein product [Durusdinium trenchii]|uniref:Rubredoxin (Rd) n=3 Tax=Durusdinium trenchii TaxID=1381693 RepID=A0ABP0S1G8_9DINO